MICDPYGNPITSRKFAAAAVNDREARPWEAVRLADIDKLIPRNDHRTLVYVSRRLYQNMGPVRGAIDQRAMYSVGRAWRPKFLGKATEWGKLAREWLERFWFPTCDVRGPNHDWQTGLYLDSVHIDRDGDIGCAYVKSEDGWPQLQRIPAHRIGQRMEDTEDALDGTGRLKTGPYKGLRISNGVVLNDLDRPVAYKVLGDDPDGKQDRYISSRDMDFSYDPQWHDQNRGLPVFVHALNDWRDMLQSLDWERQAQLIMSAIGLIEYNEDGMADPTDPSALFGKPGVAPSTGLEVKTMQGGLIRYMKAGSGAKLEAMKMDRPGEVWENFWDRGIRSAMAGANWPMSMVWKPSGQGTAERADLQRADRAVMDRQDLLEPLARRRVGWALSVAINLGELPEYPGDDIGGQFQWGFTKPAKISIDLGRDSRATIDAWKAGFTNQSKVISENGDDPEDAMYERAREIARRKQIAAEVGAEYGVEVTDEEMTLMGENQLNIQPNSPEETP